jgi:hypothetical protein
MADLDLDLDKQELSLINKLNEVRAMKQVGVIETIKKKLADLQSEKFILENQIVSLTDKLNQLELPNELPNE